MLVLVQKKTSTVKHQKPLNASLFQTNQTPQPYSTSMHKIPFSLFTSSRDKACKAVQVVSGVELHLQDPDPELFVAEAGHGSDIEVLGVEEKGKHVSTPCRDEAGSGNSKQLFFPVFSVHDAQDHTF